MRINQMDKKVLLIIISTFLFVSFGFTQDSLKVAKDDWKYIKETTMELDSALIECEKLGKLYESRMTEFQMEIYNLRLANQVADTIITKKDLQLTKRKEQVNLLNMELKKKKFEIWMYRSGGVLLIVFGLVLLK